MWLQTAIEGICEYIKGIDTVETDSYSFSDNKGTVYVRKCGRVVSVQIVGSNASSSYTASSYTTICTIAAKYRPARDTTLLIGDASTTTMSASPMWAKVTTAGLVQVYRFSGNASSVRPQGVITYITA